MLESPGRLQVPWEEDQEGALAGEPALSRKAEPPQLPQARLASRWQGRCPELGPHAGRATLRLLTQQRVRKAHPCSPSGSGARPALLLKMSPLPPLRSLPQAQLQ